MRLLRRHPTLLFLAAMGCGLLLGHLGRDSGSSALSAVLVDVATEAVDPVIMIMLTLLFLDVRFRRGRELLRSRRTAVVVLTLNFLVLPLVALGLATLLIPGDDLLRLGVLIYLLFPCTDWYLGFTRVARGNTALGTALIPVSLGAQLLLYPFWVSLATERTVPGVLELLGPAVVIGLLMPVGIALLVRVGLPRVGLEQQARSLQRGAATAVPSVIAALILCLFTSGVGEAAPALRSAMHILLAVVAFFGISFVLAELVSHWCRLDAADLVLVVMTTSARNAPLMLAATALTLGDHAVISAAILVGMLVEFPHLALLSWWLRRRGRRRRAGMRRAGSRSAGAIVG